jgi:hypothetical protein
MAASNTLGTTAGTLIVQEALKTALTRLPIITQVAHNLSPDSALFNQTVNFSLVTATTTGTYSTSTGYAEQNSVQADKQVTINKHVYADITINDQERSASEVELIARFTPVVVHALFKKPVTDLLALVHSANFSASVNESTVGDIDRDTLVAAALDLDETDTPDMGRFAVLAPSAFAELMKDTSIVSQDYRAETPSVSGRIGLPVQGFSVQTYSALSTSENTRGFCGWRDSLLFAARVPVLPQVGTLPGQIYNVTNSETGLTAQVRQWYDMILGKERMVITMMYGVAVGNPVFLTRLTTTS